MKKRILLKQFPTLTLAVAAAMFVASCNSPADENPVKEQYGDHEADLKKIFGANITVDRSSRSYTATKVSTDKQGEDNLTGWKNEYTMTFKTAKEERKVGNDNLPVLNFTATLPEGVRAGHKEVAPESGTLALGKKSGSEIPVTRFKGAAVDDKFKEGKLTVKENGDLVLKYRIEGVKDPARSEGTYESTWTYELEGG